MATHSNIPAWRIPWTGEPGGLLSMGSHRVRHDWSDLAAAAAAVYSQCLLLTLLFYCIGRAKLSLSASHSTATEIMHLWVFWGCSPPFFYANARLPFWIKYLEWLLLVSFLFPLCPSSLQKCLNHSGPKRYHSIFFLSFNASSPSSLLFPTWVLTRQVTVTCIPFCIIYFFFTLWQ